MTRSAVALASAAVLAIGCNDYQFNPVGHCLVQPGSVQVRLPSTSSADLLFIVDDSPSMDPKQVGLANSFADFISRMVQTNTARASKGLQPIDFHIAVTTSSIFFAAPASTSCVPGASGPQCCQASQCTTVSSCTRGTGTGCGAGQVCVTNAVYGGNWSFVVDTSFQCCTPSSCTPSTGCAPGDPCPVLSTSYAVSTSPPCTLGLATAGEPYPAGNLVSAPGNPKVLEFGKDLGWATWGTTTPDPALVNLVAQFRQNIQVGSCGSGEEQHLEAARLALEKAAAGQQPGLATAFPRAGAKLVLVWVGDEDDCSNPISAPLVMPLATPGADACVLDKHRPAGDQREFAVSDYASFFTGLVGAGGVADLGAAFIVSSARCTDGTYVPADTCTGPAWCPVTPPASCGAAPMCSGAYAAGVRFFQLADLIRSKGYEVVEGTVCDAYPPATFGPVLSEIADLAAPPSKLELPSMPAARAVSALVILDGAGGTRKLCTQGSDWCFVSCTDPSVTPACLTTGTSQCIAINHTTGRCEANPGETYQAEYLGFVPEGGCATVDDCNRALGGKDTKWSCIIEPGQPRGTCACSTGR